MDVTTNYNSANIAAMQNRPAGIASNGATERPVQTRQIDRANSPASPNAPARPQDINSSNRASLREENVTDAMLERAFEDANKVLSGSSFRLSYNTHKDSGRIMVTVHEAQSDEVLRQIPMESRLDIYARITEFVGLLFDQGN
ncbi:MAG: flagellar protein FlaG [Defluviitaleaceae bacterium]|nr:flagellar protein FlaG [Defluviitaleaceae bacterium]